MLSGGSSAPSRPGSRASADPWALPAAGRAAGVYCRRVTRLAWIVDLDDADLAAAVARLRDRLAAGGVGQGTPSDADAIVVWADRPLASPVLDRSVPVLLAGPTLLSGDPDGRLAEAAGVRVSGRTPVHDVRVRPGRDGARLPRPGHRHTGDDHLGMHEHVTDGVCLVEKVLDDVEVLRVAAIGLSEHAVMTWRPSTSVGVWTLGSSPACSANGLPRSRASPPSTSPDRAF